MSLKLPPAFRLLAGAIIAAFAWTHDASGNVIGETERHRGIGSGLEYPVSGRQGTVANALAPTVEYRRGPDMGGGIGGLLHSLRGGTPKYNLGNGRGDVVAQSDQSGALTWTASYEAFGTRPVETGTNADRQRANTKEEDPTGLLWEHFRYRDLETGVWLSRDPAGFVDGPNLYAYVNQNPWTKFDPLGLELEEPTKREVREDSRESDEAHNTMVDRYENTKENSPAFNKVVDHLKGAEGDYSVKMTDRDRSYIEGSMAYISQRAVKESTEKTVEALAEELGHLAQNGGEAAATGNPEFANATSEQRARMSQKAMDGANLGVFDESNVQAVIYDPNFNVREALAGRISNIVTTEVRIAKAQQGDEPFYSGDTSGGRSLGDNPSFRSNYNETPNRRSNGNIIPNSMNFQKPFGGYPFNEMRDVWKSRK